MRPSSLQRLAALYGLLAVPTGILPMLALAIYLGDRSVRPPVPQIILYGGAGCFFGLCVAVGIPLQGWLQRWARCPACQASMLERFGPGAMFRLVRGIAPECPSCRAGGEG